MEDFTPEQLEKLALLKTKVSDIISTLAAETTTDSEMVRWLQARAWNLEKAEEMFRASTKWRQEFKPEELLETYKPPEVMEDVEGGKPGCSSSRRRRKMLLEPKRKTVIPLDEDQDLDEDHDLDQDAGERHEGWIRSCCCRVEKDSI